MTGDEVHKASQPSFQPRWAGFDATWYCLRYPDVLPLMQEKDVDTPEMFYREIGAACGHSPNRYFDEAWYRTVYPDVQEGIATQAWPSGFAHYCQEGYRNRAPHWLFDEEHYRHQNPGLTDHVLAKAGLRNGYDHYLSVGEKQGLEASPFVDGRLCRDMAQRYPEWFGDDGLLASWLVLPAAIADAMPLSWYFDPVWYRERYPEVGEAIAAGRYANALHHYLTNDTPRQFDPSPFFSEEFYLAHSPDIGPTLEAGSFRNGYEHFVRFGVHEGRPPAEGVDLARYGQNLLVQAQCDSGAFDSPFARLVAERQGYGSPTGAEVPDMTEAQSRQLFRREAGVFLSMLARSPLDFQVYGLPEVSIIMVVHDQIELTVQALASLRANYAGAIELIIVDSGSRDETRRLDRLVRGAVILRYRGNIGYLEGCNAALEKARAPAVLYLNNDVRLYPNTLRHALSRLYAAPSIGAVTAKLVRSNMCLQEAGSIIWRNGATYGYRREDDPNLPEANFVRDVDYGSAAFLLARTGLLRRLGGYDTRYRPAYFEDTDLCVRLHKAGARIVYEPLCVVEHLEFGSSGHAGSHALIQKQWDVFARTHQDFLRHQQPQHIRNALLGRERRQEGRRRILFVEDRVPLRGLGSGYVRSNDIIRALVALDYHVTVFPVHPVREPFFLLYREFPEEVELALEQNVGTLPAFLEERAGYYDLIWIGRTHNMARLLPLLNEASRFLTHCGAVLDTEVVAAPRTLLQRALSGSEKGQIKKGEQSLDAMLKEELRCAHYCQQIVAVTEHDADLIRQAGYSDVMVLGHGVSVAPTPRPWAERKGILFLGAMHDKTSPNYDSMMWFVRDVLPLLDELPEEAMLTIAGYVPPQMDLAPLACHPRVDILGAVDALEPLFDRHRVFVAPTRFAGGLPFKVHEAAAYGLPMVVTTLLRDQVGWKDGEALLSAPLDDPQAFASAVMTLYGDEALWQRLRDGALEAVARDADPVLFRERLAQVLAASLPV